MRSSNTNKLRLQCHVIEKFFMFNFLMCLMTLLYPQSWCISLYQNGVGRVNNGQKPTTFIKWIQHFKFYIEFSCYFFAIFFRNIFSIRLRKTFFDLVLEIYSKSILSAILTHLTYHQPLYVFSVYAKRIQNSNHKPNMDSNLMRTNNLLTAVAVFSPSSSFICMLNQTRVPLTT